MAVDYTKVFTVIGKYVDKVIDYYGQIATYTSDKSAIESMLATESLVRLGDGLTDMYDGFKQETSSNIEELISRISDVLTDETLIGANFSFGQAPSLEAAFEALLHDMSLNDKNVTANVATVGSVTYVTTNSLVGKLISGTTLDGVTPPLAGAQPILDYYTKTSQLTPTSETLTFRCIADSESGNVAQGSEVFEITGTGGASSGYSPEGENSGNLGTTTVIDNSNTILSNGSFDSWTAGEPDSWTNTGDAGTYVEGTVNIYGDFSSLKTVQADGELFLAQTMSANLFERRRAYFLSLWAAKDTDVGTDETITVLLADGAGTFNSMTVNPSTTAWTNYKLQFVPPIEITGDVTISIATGVLDVANDPVLIDNVVIAPCEYFEGAAFAITAGPEKFLLNDQLIVGVSNTDAGKFQTYFRKAHKIQLSTDATPTISDSLVA